MIFRYEDIYIESKSWYSLLPWQWIKSNLFLRQVQSIADAALTEQNEMISGRQRARGAQNGRYGGVGGYAGIFNIC